MKTVHNITIILNGLIVSAIILSAIAVAQEQRIFWIGPDGECDHSTIQKALTAGAGERFDDELRLSLAYSHSGMIRLPAGIVVRGGFSACKGKFSGTYTALHAPAMESLFVIEPGDTSAPTEFSYLRLSGDNLGPIRGGVIRMLPGWSGLILKNVVIQHGNANQGGAIYLGAGAKIELHDTLISANEAIRGGGIYCETGSSVLLNSGRIEDNIAQLAGGGLFAQHGCKIVADPDTLARMVAGNRVENQEVAVHNR